MMKKNQNRLILIVALLIGSALILGYISRNNSRNTEKDVTCTAACEKTVKEKILQSDIPFLESLTRHFLILYN